MEKKMTKKEMFTMILGVEEVAKNTMMVDFIKHEIELLNKKSASKKNTKVQTENIGIMEQILEVLKESENALTVTEIQKKSDGLAEFSNQKISALLRKMIENGSVEKVIEKKKSYFKAI